MKPELNSNGSTANHIRFVESAVCELCGRFGACQIGDRMLCENCYEGCGSCCPEFGKDDLWKLRDEIEF